MRNRHVVMILVVLTSIIASLDSPAATGGEQGNGRYISYTNLVANFSTQYPKTWNVIEFGSGATFVEPVVEHRNQSGVNINVSQFDDVQRLEDLYQYISFFNPDTEWEKIEFSQLPGYLSESEGKGLIYLIKENTEIVSVHYKVGSDEQAARDVERILTELTF